MNECIVQNCHAHDMQDYAQRRAIRGELRALQKEERQRQQKAVDEVLQRAAVVCTTLTGAPGRELARLYFDVAVIDEAAQARVLHALDLKPNRCSLQCAPQWSA
jgi:superfamily I DNA and/or RNA helicase